MANSVKFRHFSGNILSWENKIESGQWDNSIVFGRIWGIDGNNRKWAYKIYAGHVDTEGQAIDFLYDCVSAEEIRELELRISAIEDLTNLDFKNAIINAVDANYANSEHSGLGSRLESIENSILWVEHEDIEEE